MLHSRLLKRLQQRGGPRLGVVHALRLRHLRYHKLHPLSGATRRGRRGPWAVAAARGRLPLWPGRLTRSWAMLLLLLLLLLRGLLLLVLLRRGRLSCLVLPLRCRRRRRGLGRFSPWSPSLLPPAQPQVVQVLDRRVNVVAILCQHVHNDLRAGSTGARGDSANRRAHPRAAGSKGSNLQRGGPQLTPPTLSFISGNRARSAASVAEPTA